MLTVFLFSFAQKWFVIINLKFYKKEIKKSYKMKKNALRKNYNLLTMIIKSVVH